MNSPPLRVLVVSEDRRLLRQMSRFLNMFGYRVQQVAGTEHARTALEGEPPHVMILDAAANQEAIHWLCEQAPKPNASGHVFTLLMLGRATARGIVDAVAAGADDFLQLPIVYGELLARLRAAARAIELERRVRQQEGVELLTGLPNREAFAQLLRRRSQGNEDLACVVVDLDLLGRVNRGHGFATGDETIQAAAEELAATCGDEVVLASFGGGRFGALFADPLLEAAKTWAKRARQAIAEMEIPHGEQVLRVTASFGVATGPAEQLVRWAEEALQAAKHSGRDCVVCHGQFEAENRAWIALAAPGKLFERTAAHHVMSPLPVLLREDETAASAATLLESTCLDALAVIHSDGRLAGVIAAESNFADPSSPLSEVMDTDVATFDEDTSLAAMLEFFTHESPSRAVITRRAHPTGLVTREQLATLSEPVAVDRFAPGKPCSGTSDYLVVIDRALAGSTW